MKKYLLVWIALYPLLTLAQNPDTIALKIDTDSTLAICDSLLDIGNYEEAMALAQETKEKVVESTGRESALYADCLYTIGRIGSESGNYALAEEHLIEAVSLRKKRLGEAHEDYLQALLILGSTYTDMGRYDEAEPVLQTAVDIAEKAFGPTHHRYVRGLIFQGILYEGLGQYEYTERLLLKALSIVEQHYNKEDRFYAIIHNNLGILYAQSGRYLKCEQHFLISNTLVKEQYGETHIQFAGNLFNLGFLYDNTGRYDKAEACYLQSKSIVEQNMGRDNFYYAGVANNLGLLYYHTGQLDEAEQYFREAIEIRTELVGGPHPSTATSLNNLALVFEKMGQYDAAQEQHLKALSMREELLGKSHPDYAQSMSNLGSLNLKKQQYAQAESLYLEANRLWEETLGREHPHIARNLINLGICFSITNRSAEAEAALVEASGIQRRQLEKATRYLSESELTAYTSMFHTYQDVIQTVTAAAVSTRPALAALGYDNILFYKGFLLNEAQRLRKLVNTDSTARRQFELLSSYYRQLAPQYAQPISERQGVDELESQINKMERTLASTAAGFSDAARQATWQDVQRQLPPKGAAIEFVRYRHHLSKSSDEAFYAALVLRPGWRMPQWIYLCEEQSLNSLLPNSSSGRKDEINRLYIPDWGGTAPAKKTLYSLLWAPLEEVLDGAQSIYFAPDGLLHRLNLGAIADEQGDLLADRFQMVRLSSTRQLINPYSKNNAPDNAMLFGGIRYNMDTTALLEAVETMTNIDAVASRGALPFENMDTTLRGTSWTYLPGSAREVAALEKIMNNNHIPTEIRREYTATEEAFKQIGTSQPSPTILHLATHGYFFPDAAPTSSEGRELAAPSGGGFKVSEHPMIRSGLILAGGNHAWQGNSSPAGLEDGILTAYEISQMNLSTTKLAVLSACDTGLGDIAANEGVYGLQRAFKIAGARHLLLSLWKVPDLQATQLMEAFYNNWLEDKMPIHDALLAAQRYMREEGWPPYYWAGFVLME